METYTARLMQENGVSGPQTTFAAEGDAQAIEHARDWADAQTGKPWDVLTIEDETGHCVEVVME